MVPILRSSARSLAHIVAIFLVAFFGTNTISAQTISYSFTYFTLEVGYNDLVDDTVVSDLAWGSGGFSAFGYTNWTIPLGFNFQFFERPTDKMYVMTDATVLADFPEHDSSGMELDARPHNELSPLSLPMFDRAWDPYMHYVPGMVYDSVHPGFSPLSPISYKTEGVAPHRIAKIQYKNAGFLCDTTHHSFINFQVWLYEDSNIIEYRYGPQLVDPCIFGRVPFNDSGYNKGCYVGLTNDRILGSCSEGGRSLGVDGPGDAPHLDDYSSPTYIPAYPWRYLEGVPPYRMVYRFAPYVDTAGTTPIDSATAVAVANMEHARFEVTPNPASNTISIDHNGIKDGIVTLFDMTGRMIWQKELAATANINIEGLAAGTYIARLVSSDSKIYTTRFSKK